MKMIERWEWIEKRMGIIFLPIYRGHEFKDRFGIFNHMSIAIDDCVAFEWHKEILLSLPISYFINPPCLVKTGSAVESDSGFVMARCRQTIFHRADRRCR